MAKLVERKWFLTPKQEELFDKRDRLEKELNGIRANKCMVIFQLASGKKYRNKVSNIKTEIAKVNRQIKDSWRLL